MLCGLGEAVNAKQKTLPVAISSLLVSVISVFSVWYVLQCSDLNQMLIPAIVSASMGLLALCQVFSTIASGEPIFERHVSSFIFCFATLGLVGLIYKAMV